MTILDKELYEIEIDGVVTTKTGEELKQYIIVMKRFINFEWEQPSNQIKTQTNGRDLQPVV